MTDEWGRPADTGGEFVSPKQLANHLVIVFPRGYVPHIQTRFSQPGKLSDAVCVDVVDLDDKDDNGLPGKVYRNCNWMQSQMIASLRPMIGSKVLGVVTQGAGKSGMNPPWIVRDMVDDPACRQRADEWKRTNPQFVPSTFVLRDSSQQQAEPSYGATTSQASYGQPSGQGAQGYSPPQDRGYEPQGQVRGGAVAGSVSVSDEELSLLQRHRAQRQQSQSDDPPF